MTQCIQSGDYNGASNAQKQLVSGPDFHDQMMSISLFRTGLYTLLQCAKQLQVYLRWNAWLFLYKNRLNLIVLKRELFEIITRYAQSSQ